MFKYGKQLEKILINNTYNYYMCKFYHNYLLINIIFTNHILSKKFQLINFDYHNDTNLLLARATSNSFVKTLFSPICRFTKKNMFTQLLSLITDIDSE